MYTLNIEDDQGHKMEVPFGPGMVTLGRSAENTIRLDERNVSRQHARINAQNGAVYIEDTSSSYGVKVNGDRITGKVAVFLNDRITVGDFTLQVYGEQLRLRPEEITQKTTVPKATTSDEVTNTQPMMVAPVGQQAKPAPHPQPEEDDSHEATAIIRMTEVPSRSRTSGTMVGPIPKLVCIKGPRAGSEWLVNKNEITIGRDDDCDIPIDHRSMSRKHAKIQVDGGKFRVVDLKSANGTLVNGEEYAQVELKKGDIIELGHVKLRLLWPGEAVPPIDRSNKDDDDEATSIKFVPNRTSPQRGKGMWVALGLGVTAAAGVIITLIVTGENKTQAPLGGVIAQQVAPQNAATPQPSTPPPTAPATEPPAQAVKPVAQVLEQAKEEESREHWDGALAILREGTKAHVGDASLGQAVERDEAERGAKSTFDAAENALDRGDPATAKELFGQIAETSRYYPRASKRLAELKNVKEPRQAKQPRSPKTHAQAAEPPAQANKPEPVTAAPSASPREQAKKFVDQGNQAIIQNHVKEAIDLYNQALGAEPKYAPAQRALGIAHARAGNGEVSIEHYRAYLKLAPAANDAEQVKKIIHDFEAGGEE